MALVDGRAMSMRIVAVLGVVVVACGPSVGQGDGDADGRGSESSEASSRGHDDGPASNDGAERGDDTTSTTTTSTATFTTASDEVDDGDGFIMRHDGGPGTGCEQPMPLEQPSSCGNGIREPDEFCYQGIASISAMAEGTRLVDFGEGPQV